VDFSEHTGLLLEALRFSADKHRNQRRKDQAQSPYINHPIDVAHLLWNAGGVRDADVLVAAVLHDTIEDTQTTRTELAERFGDAVLGLVLEVTDDKSLPKAERKRLQVETASHKSRSAKLIKLADKICNVRDVVASPPSDWSLERRKEYLNWTEQVVVGVRGVNAALEAMYDGELAKGKAQLGMD
jgi:guanosine-3',5'-bis(diphosphate) 3'-pyrophosphohydrolase